MVDRPFGILLEKEEEEMVAKDSDGLIPVRIYQKEIDGNNNGIFALIKRNGNEYAEVRIYPPE